MHAIPEPQHPTPPTAPARPDSPREVSDLGVGPSPCTPRCGSLPPLLRSGGARALAASGLLLGAVACAPASNTATAHSPAPHNPALANSAARANSPVTELAPSRRARSAMDVTRPPSPKVEASTHPHASAPAPGAETDSSASAAVSAPAALAASVCPEPAAAVAQLYARNLDRSGAERALIEAVRLRLDDLSRHACGPNLGSRALRDHVFRLAPRSEFPLSVEAIGEQTTLMGYHHERDSWVALYQWKDGKVRTLVGVHGTTNPTAELPDAMLTQLLPLDYAVFKPSGATLPSLVVVNTHPWIASCWRSLRLRVLAPSGDPYQPTTLLDETLSGRWCETPRLTQTGNTLHVDYLGWAGLWSQQHNVWRARRKSYEYTGSTLTEHFGFAPAWPNDDGADTTDESGSAVFLNLVEAWLEAPWSLAAEATSPTARNQLAPVHERLRAQLPLLEEADPTDSYTSELFPLTSTSRRVVLYCATSAGTPCPSWPHPVVFRVERTGEVWLVDGVDRSNMTQL